MGAMKVAAFLQILQLGRVVLVSDVDTVWTADPQPYFSALTVEHDVAVTSDCLSREADGNKRGDNPRFDRHGVWFCGHNPGNTFGATFNTGVLRLAPTKAAIEFTRRWHAKLLAPTDDWHMEDQRGFNILVMDNFYPTVGAADAADGSVVLAANKTLRLMPLPSGRFCSGHTFFIQQSGRPQACLNVHVTFTEGGVHQGHTRCTATPCASHAVHCRSRAPCVAQACTASYGASKRRGCGTSSRRATLARGVTSPS